MHFIKKTDKTQQKGMDHMVILTQMMCEMKTQREVEQHRFEADQPRHEADHYHNEDQMQFEGDEHREEARQRKADLQA
jgi:hypothetical protein